MIKPTQDMFGKLDVLGACTVAVFVTLSLVYVFPQVLLLHPSAIAAGKNSKPPPLAPSLFSENRSVAASCQCEAKRSRLVHVHVVAVGDSLTLGVTGLVDSVHPYASIVANRLEGIASVVSGRHGESCMSVVSTSSSVLGYQGLTSAQIQALVAFTLYDVKSESNPLRRTWRAAVDDAASNRAQDFVVVVGVLVGANDAIIVPKSLVAMSASLAAHAAVPEDGRNDLSVNDTVKNTLAVVSRLDELFSALAEGYTKKNQGSNQRSEILFHRLLLALDQVPQVQIPQEGRPELLARFCPPLQLDPIRVCPLLCESVWLGGDDNQNRLHQLSEQMHLALKVFNQNASRRSALSSFMHVADQVPVCDVSSIIPTIAVQLSRRRQLDESHLHRHFSDCIHLSAVGYKRWSLSIAQRIKLALTDYFSSKE